MYDYVNQIGRSMARAALGFAQVRSKDGSYDQIFVLYQCDAPTSFDHASAQVR